MSETLKVVSLFSGIGGFETGIHNSLGKENVDVVFASEINPYAVKGYTEIYKGKVHGDITQISEYDIPEHNLLCAGFPCQAFSLSGKRLGFADTRGTLFFDVARIAKEKQPEKILLENVKGLVSHDKGRTLDIIIETLNDIGYTVDLNICNTKYFGLPQNRERIFIIAYRNDTVEKQEWHPEGTKIIAKAKRRLKTLGINTFNFNWPKQEVVTTRLRDILEENVDEKYYIDDEKIKGLLKELPKTLPIKNNKINMVGNVNGFQDGIVVDTNGVSKTILSGNSKKYILEEPTIQTVGFIDIKGHDGIRKVFHKDGLSPTIDTMGGGNREPKVLEEGIAIKEATKKGYRMAHIGDSINIQYPNSKTRRGRIGDQIANTLEASNINQCVLLPKYRVRKLTELECFRLQGFPDSYVEALKRIGTSKTQIYKMAGNSVSVNVIESIIHKMYQKQ